MKTIKPPNKPPGPFKIKCRHAGCGAIMQCELSELRFESDRDRDGDALVMRCPHCKGETWIAAHSS